MHFPYVFETMLSDCQIRALSLSVFFCQCLTHLWLDDSKQVPANDKLLGKAVVLIRLEGDAKEAHDAGVAGQV